MRPKDFTLIAEVIKDLEMAETTKLTIAYAFAKELPRTNAKFDTERFINSCMPDIWHE